MESLTRASISTGTHWEARAGYARAVHVGERILVSGTTATGPDGVVGAGDPAAQARYIIDKIEAAISQLGGTLRDVVNARVCAEYRRLGGGGTCAWRAVWRDSPGEYAGAGAAGRRGVSGRD